MRRTDEKKDKNGRELQKMEEKEREKDTHTHTHTQRERERERERICRTGEKLRID